MKNVKKTFATDEVTTSILETGQYLFTEAGHPLVANYQVNNQIVQLIKTISPLSSFGLTITVYEMDESGEVTPEFGAILDGKHCEVLIDPFGLTPDKPEFNACLATSQKFLIKVLRKTEKEGSLLEGKPGTVVAA